MLSAKPEPLENAALDLNCLENFNKKFWRAFSGAEICQGFCIQTPWHAGSQDREYLFNSNDNIWVKVKEPVEQYELLLQADPKPYLQLQGATRNRKQKAEGASLILTLAKHITLASHPTCLCLSYTVWNTEIIAIANFEKKKKWEILKQKQW